MVLGNRTNDQTDGIDPLQNVAIIVSDQTENELIKKGQSQLKGIDRKVGIPIGDSTEIVFGKLLCRIINRPAIGGGTAFRKVGP